MPDATNGWTKPPEILLMLAREVLVLLWGKCLSEVGLKGEEELKAGCIDNLKSCSRWKAEGGIIA